MTFRQKSTIATLVALLGSYGVYAVIIGARLSSAPARDVSYKPLMIVMTVLLAILMAVSHGAIAATAPSQAGETDERDREISWRSSRIGSYVLASGVFGALVLALFETPYFYIANALLLSWVAAELVGGVVALVLYRRGL